MGTFKFQLKKTVHYRNDYKDDRNKHPLWDIQMTIKKKQFGIEMITKMREPCILCGDIKIPTEKQLSIGMISKITELYILCGDIQIPTEKHRLLFK